jgi:YHS domain-containing protein
MTVTVGGAEHTATHDGERYWFCGPGCREHFAAGPGAVLDGSAHRH